MRLSSFAGVDGVATLVDSESSSSCLKHVLLLSSLCWSEAPCPLGIGVVVVDLLIAMCPAMSQKLVRCFLDRPIGLPQDFIKLETV